MKDEKDDWNLELSFFGVSDCKCAEAPESEIHLRDEI
jgi:hypothetical protein